MAPPLLGGITALRPIRRIAELGEVTPERLAALGRLAAYEGADQGLTTAASLAAKALRLQRLGFEIGPEARHLLRRLGEQREIVGAPTGGVRQLVATVRGTGSPRDSAAHPEPERFKLPGSPPLSLYLPPTIWRPANWTLTLATPIFKREIERLKGLEGIELGTGSGILSIALLKAGVARMIGLDLNPDSPLIAGLNASVNLPPQLLARIGFAQSDLLDSVAADYGCDFIIGCLPQVVSEGAGRKGGEGGLRILGDVYEPTHEVEDLFGLSLLSRALRGAQVHLKAEGFVELVVGGRPGKGVLLELFQRQGYLPEIVHQERIPQDPDPPLETLSKMERDGGIRFEFFLGDSDRPISAQEAARHPLKAVTHDLFVVRGIPMRDLERRAASTVALLRAPTRFGYTAHPGTEDPDLRALIAARYQALTGIRADLETIFIGPSAQELLANLVRVATGPGDKILVTHRNAARFVTARRVLRDRRFEIVGDSFEEVEKGMRRHRPALTLFNITIRDRENSDGLERIAALAERHDSLLVTAGFFPRASGMSPYPLARLLRGSRDIAQRLVILTDLARRDRLLTTHLSSAIIPNRNLYQALAREGEITYSRASTPGQRIAAALHRATNPASSRAVTVPLRAVEGDPERFGRGLKRYRHAPSLPSRRVPPRGDLIDLGFGESEGAVRGGFWRGIREVLDDPLSPEVEARALQAVQKYLRESRGIEGVEVAAGPGVLPLQADAVRAVARIFRRRPPVLIPVPNYDVHFPLIEAAGGEAIPLDVGPDTRLRPEYLRPAKGLRGPVVLWLTTPTNPGGQYFTLEGLQALAAALPNATVFSDEIYGLTMGPGVRMVSAAALPEGGPRWRSVLTFVGLSKEFGQTAGIRAGFVATDDRALLARIREERTSPIDPIALGTAAHVFGEWGPIVRRHRDWLQRQRSVMEYSLEQMGIRFLPSQGGYGTLANFSSVYGKTYRGEEITRGNLHEILEREAGLQIKPVGWGGTDRVRLVYSIGRLGTAIRRLGRFLREVR